MGEENKTFVVGLLWGLNVSIGVKHLHRCLGCDFEVLEGSVTASHKVDTVDADDGVVWGWGVGVWSDPPQQRSVCSRVPWEPLEALAGVRFS